MYLVNIIDILDYQTDVDLRENIKYFTYGRENPNNCLIHCLSGEYLVNY